MPAYIRLAFWREVPNGDAFYEHNFLTGQEQQKELDRAKKILMDAGADRVIRSLKELPHIIFS